ncbi:MAG: hypothetical protein L3J86_06070 [Thermoplasmata archaeon]|nr:hypothetical protein [Thermoplasmata archaeon]
MAGFLRRLRRPKDADPEAEEEAAPEPTEEPELEPAPEGETYEAGDFPEVGEAIADPDPVTPTMEPEEPATPEAPAFTPSGAPPPPLPEMDRNAARSSIAPRRSTTQCFLCGTELDGPWCPTCRMAWAE